MGSQQGGKRGGGGLPSQKMRARPPEWALLKGYVSEYPLLPDTEAPHLLPLACARLAISVTLGVYSYAQDPSNHYLLIHAEPVSHFRTRRTDVLAIGPKYRRSLRGPCRGTG